jgi:hypothetical protein
VILLVVQTHCQDRLRSFNYATSPVKRVEFSALDIHLDEGGMYIPQNLIQRGAMHLRSAAPHRRHHCTGSVEPHRLAPGAYGKGPKAKAWPEVLRKGVHKLLQISEAVGVRLQGNDVAEGLALALHETADRVAIVRPAVHKYLVRLQSNQALGEIRLLGWQMLRQHIGVQ